MIEELSIGRLLFLRRVTQAVSSYLLVRLKEELNTLSPLFRPRRLLGDYIESGSPEPIVDAEKNFAVLSDLYARAAGKPFDLPRPLRPPLKPIGLGLEVYPWEYPHEIRIGGSIKRITITSPVRWVISYTSGLSLARLRSGVAGREERNQGDIQEFVIRCCLMRAVLSKYPGIANLLRSLRWQVSSESQPDLGGLPLTTLTAPIQSMLPPDHLVIESTEMSGMAVFEEIVDLDGLARIPDPLAEKVQSLIAAAQPRT